MSNPDSSSSSIANDALSITGSIVSILTFLYALLVTFYIYAKTAVSSPQEINEFIISLQFSYEEIQAFAHSYANFERERLQQQQQQYYYHEDDDKSWQRQRQPFLGFRQRHDPKAAQAAPPRASPFPFPTPSPFPDPSPDPSAQAQALAAKAHLIELHTSQRLSSLRQLALRVGTMASDGFFRRWSNRLRYALLQEEVAKQVQGKDKLMEELRRVREEFDRILRERRRRHHDALIQRQTALLGEILHRLDALEERSMSTVGGSTDASVTPTDKPTPNGVSRHYEEKVRPFVLASEFPANIDLDQGENGVGELHLTSNRTAG